MKMNDVTAALASGYPGIITKSPLVLLASQIWY
jgi:hypothetical protein